MLFLFLSIGHSRGNPKRSQISSVKGIVRRVSRTESMTLLNKAMEFSTAEEIERFVRVEMERRFAGAD